MPADRPGTLRSGSWQATLDAGGLRWITFDGHEVLRGITPTVRDADWWTIQPEVVGLRAPSPSEISCTARYRSTDLAVDLELTYTLDADLLRVRSTARIIETTVAQRIGLATLFPLSVVGQQLWAPAGGELTVDRFPQTIWPTLLGSGLNRLEWSLGDDGGRATLTFTGDRWEIEDQRNWSDASFKGFTPPLGGAEPRTFQAGETIERGITLLLSPRRPPASPGPSHSATRPDSSLVASVEVGNRPGAELPRIGCLLTGVALDDAIALAELAPAHLRLPLDGRHEGWRTGLAAGIALARQTDAALVLELIQSGADLDLTEFAEAVADAAPPVTEILAFDIDDGRGAITSSERQLLALRDALRQAGCAVPVGGGTRASFRELNEPALHVSQMDLVTFEVTPQVHAIDDVTILENLDTLPLLAREVSRLTGALPLDIACALRPRLDPYRRSPVPEPDENRIDLRLHTQFGAAWIVGVLAQLAQAGAHRLTLLEATGPAGWIPDGQPSGDASPLTRLLAAVPRRGQVLSVRCDPGIVCLGVSAAKRQIIVAANISGQPLDASFLLSGRLVEQVTVLDDSGLNRYDVTGGSLGASPLVVALPPLAVAMVDAVAEQAV